MLTYFPCDQLKPYIKMFMIIESFEESTYNVLPDTSLVMGFQYKGKLSYFENNKEIPLAISGITGLNDSFRIFKNLPNTGTILVIFRETGARLFIAEPLNELFNKSISLNNFTNHSKISDIEEQLSESLTNEQRIKIIENYLISRLIQKDPDTLILQTIDLIYQSRGKTKITDLAETIYLSQSALEKRFRKVVGTSPKKFSSIVRIKNILNEYKSSKSFTDLAYKTGYFDQAHFSKDFKIFSGKTPEKYFSINPDF